MIARNLLHPENFAAPSPANHLPWIPGVTPPNDCTWSQFSVHPKQTMRTEFRGPVALGKQVAAAFHEGFRWFAARPGPVGS